MKEYYKILGLEEGATVEEIETAYKNLKEKYSRERFFEGEEGNVAARNLTRVETAYAEIMSNIRTYGSDNNGSYIGFDEIENLIKEGRLSEAQDKLDDFSERNAEWHYLQAVIFYKKNWTNESKKQLEIAIDMDSSNEKYKDAYDKLKKKTEYNANQFRSGNYNDNQSVNDANRQMGASGTNDCLSFCATWCCMNMLCNMCCH